MESSVSRLPGDWHIPYQYSIGRAASEFFEGLKNEKILGSRCESCGRVFVPPKSFCEFDFKSVDNMIEVGHQGVIEAVTVVTAPFAGSPPVPYCVAYVRLDGATSSIANFVRGLDLGDGSSLPSLAQVGGRVRVNFRDDPEGRITDFWFTPIG